MAKRLEFPCLRLLAAGLGWLLMFEGLAVQCAAQAGGQNLRIVVVEGDGAINNIRQQMAKAPVVRVEDDDNRPVAKATVVFLLPDVGAGGTFLDRGNILTVLTDEKGLAIGRGLRPNNMVGQFQIRVRASYQGQTASATITQTNVAPAAKRGGSGKVLLILGLVAGAAGGAVFAVRSGGKNGGTAPQPAAPTGTVITPGAPIFGPPR